MESLVGRMVAADFVEREVAGSFGGQVAVAVAVGVEQLAAGTAREVWG
jgi:hypothetical protein